jgi:hypothetical protein
MNPVLIALGLLYAYGLVLSVKSMLVLGRQSPWTSAGWAFTILYIVAVFLEYGAHWVCPWHGEYGFLVGLTVTFIVAGVRDERQAEPWQWPVRASATRAERRSA